MTVQFVSVSLPISYIQEVSFMQFKGHSFMYILPLNIAINTSRTNARLGIMRLSTMT